MSVLESSFRLCRSSSPSWASAQDSHHRRIRGCSAQSLVVALDAQVCEDLPPLGTVELLLGPVDPAAADTQCVCRQHQVAHDQAAVVDVRGHRTVGENDEHNRGTVERIDVRTHDLGVHLRESVAHGPVLDGDDYGRLLSHACRGIGSGLDDPVDDLIRDHVRLVAADAPAGLDELDSFLSVHAQVMIFLGFLLVPLVLAL